MSSSPTFPTAINTLTETRDQLQDYADLLQEIYAEFAAATPIDATVWRDTLATITNLLNASNAAVEQLYQGALVAPTNSTTTQQRLVFILYRVTLAFGQDLSASDWTAQRVENTYQAVFNIIDRINEQPGFSNTLMAINQFIRTFGGTEIQLVAGPNANDPDALGSTDVVDRNGTPTPVIYLYKIASGVVQTPENIVHEFGHVLVFRNGKDNSQAYQEWTSIKNYIDPFPPTQGWGNNASKLQNVSLMDVEHERIANMFEAFITDYRPAIVFNTADSLLEYRSAWALWTFMTGVEPPYDPTALDDPEKTVWIDNTRQVRPLGSGIMHWIQSYGDF